MERIHDELDKVELRMRLIESDQPPAWASPEAYAQLQKAYAQLQRQKTVLLEERASASAALRAAGAAASSGERLGGGASRATCATAHPALCYSIASACKARKRETDPCG
jgi:hypothetical protein